MFATAPLHLEKFCKMVNSTQIEERSYDKQGDRN